MGQASPEEQLADRVAVVTGSSSGIGRAIARELAAAGAHVVVHACSRQSAADEVAAEIRAGGRQSAVRLADLAIPEQAARLVESCWEWRGRVDIWINNAGADVLTGDAADWTYEAKLQRLWDVDVRGTILLSRAAGERMRPAGGVILNLGWDQADTGMAGDSGEMFAATKGAIMAFSRSLAKSLAPAVRVNCLAPGWIQTVWSTQASAYWQQRARRESLRQRWGTPEDVARVARFLVSPAADFITGEVLAVNGGLAGTEAAERLP